MKKALRTIGALLLITALVIALIPASDVEAVSSASDFQMEGNKLIKYSGTSEIVTIPDDVRTIGEEAFAGNNNIVKVNIGDKVKEIEYGAFSNCNSLRTVVVGSSVEEIGPAAFSNDTALENITLGDSVRKLGSGVFAGDTGIRTFTISAGNTHLTLDGGVLYDKDKEKLFCMLPTYSSGEYTIPSTVKEINGYAFWGNPYIKNVTLSSGLTSVPEYAFSNCSNLRQVTIPLPVRSIDAKAFEDCVNLTLVNCPDSITNIHSTAFDGCPKVTINATSGSYAYNFGQTLERSEVSEVEYEDTGINTIVTTESTGDTSTDSGIKNSVTGTGSLSPNAQSDATPSEDAGSEDVATVNANTVTDAKYANGVINGADVVTYSYYDAAEDPSGLLYGSTSVVGGKAFVFIENSLSVKDGDELLSNSEEGTDNSSDSSNVNTTGTVVNSDGYYSGNLLHQIDLSKAEEKSVTTNENGEEVEYSTVANILADNAQKGNSFPKFTVANNKIASQAYYQDSSLTEYEFPEDITEIGDFAFARSGLTSADIPDGVTKIGYGAFYHCDDLTDINIPSSVTSVGAYAFADTAFLNNNNDTYVIVGDGVLIAYNGSDSIVTIPEGVKLIADGCFKDHLGITAVNLADTLEIIGEDAFNGCSNLKAVNRGENVTTIGANAFKGTKLNNVTIYPACKYIGLGAFDLTNGGTDTVTFLGSDLPSIIGGTSSQRLANVEDRTYAFGDMKTAVISNSVDSLDGTVLENGVYGFHGSVVNEQGTLKSDNSNGVTSYASGGVMLSVNSSVFTADSNSKAEIAGNEDTYVLHITDSQNAADDIERAYAELYGGRSPENLKGFNFSLYDSSDSVEIKKLGKQSVQVILPLPAGIITDNLHFVCLDSDGQLEAVEYSIEELDGTNYISFKCEHFSPYGLYNYEGTNASVSRDGTHIKDSTPDTGDGMLSPKWFLCIGCVALAIVLFLISTGKRRSPKNP